MKNIYISIKRDQFNEIAQRAMKSFRTTKGQINYLIELGLKADALGLSLKADKEE